MKLSHYLQLVATSGTNAGSHRSCINAEAAQARECLWFENSHS